MYDELVKRLREADEKSMCGECGLNLHTGATKKGVLFAEAADAIEELSKPKWIPVTERLPEPYVEVLLYSGEDRYTGYMHNDKRFTVNASHYPNRPTHWAHLLPAPPKEE